MAAPHLDKEASTAAAATFTVGLALGWLIHRHSEDIKAAGTKVSDVSSLGAMGTCVMPAPGGRRRGVRPRRAKRPPVKKRADLLAPTTAAASHLFSIPSSTRGATAACAPSPSTASFILTIPFHLPPFAQSITGAFSKLKAKLS